jgi:hypothetical protein
MHICIVSRRHVSMAAMMNLGAARVSNLVEIYAAFRHMRGNPALGSPVLGSAPDRRPV